MARIVFAAKAEQEADKVDWLRRCCRKDWRDSDLISSQNRNLVTVGFEPRRACQSARHHDLGTSHSLFAREFNEGASHSAAHMAHSEENYITSRVFPSATVRSPLDSLMNRLFGDFTEAMNKRRLCTHVIASPDPFRPDLFFTLTLPFPIPHAYT